jgi:hypothetical protein
VFGDFAIMTSTAIGGNPISAGVKRFYINPAGNVGIGTTNPGAKLDVHVAGTGIRQYGDANNILSTYAGSGYQVLEATNSGTTNAFGYNSGAFYVETAATERIRIDSAGNVGIGTTPNAYSNYTTLTLGNASGTGSILDIEYQGTRTLSVYAASNGGNINVIAAKPLILLTSGAERMRILATGQIGMGTTSPVSKLDVQSSGVIARFTSSSNEVPVSISHTSNPRSTIGFYGSTSVNDYNVRVGADGNDFIAYTNNIERMRINSSGNVGIGTTSPSEILTIPGNYGVGLGYKTFYSSGGTVPAGVGPSYYLVATLNQLQGTTLSSKHQYKFFLTTTGTGTYNSSVYIVYANSNDTAWLVREVARRGTVSNHPELTVSGTEARIYNDHPSAYGVLYRVETTNSGQANTAPDIFGSDYMWQRTEDRLTYTDGNVGIGTTLPDSKLDVTGGDITVNVSGTGLMSYKYNNSVVGSITTNGVATAFNTSSDYRLKEDLQDFAGLDMVSKIPVYDFKWKTDESRSYGVMAHELQEVLPDAVVGDKDAEEMQGVDYSKIVPLLVKSIQELKADNDSLKARIETLENN